MVKGASAAIGSKALLFDLGYQCSQPISLCSDASAAIGIASRVGIGKLRHIEVNQLWLQGKVAAGDITLHKVATEANLADALTKASDSYVVQFHVAGINGRTSNDKHCLGACC